MTSTTFILPALAGAGLGYPLLKLARRGRAPLDWVERWAWLVLVVLCVGVARLSLTLYTWWYTLVFIGLASVLTLMIVSITKDVRPDDKTLFRRIISPSAAAAVLVVLLASEVAVSGWLLLGPRVWVWMAGERAVPTLTRTALAPGLLEVDGGAAAELIKLDRTDALVFAGVRAAHALIGAVGDEDVGVRTKAADALIQIGEPAVKDLVAEYKFRPDDPSVGYNSPQDERRERVLSGVSHVLIKIGEPAVAPLLEMLPNSNSTESTRVKTTLVDIGPPAVPQLLTALDACHSYGGYSTCMDLIKILGQIRDARAMMPLMLVALKGDSYSLPASEAWDAAGKIGPRVPELIRALGNGDPNIRRAAAAKLFTEGDASAVPALTLALARDNTPAVRSAAAIALGKFGGQAAAPALVRALMDKGEGVSGAAGTALASMGDAAVPALVAVLNDVNHDLVRSAAVTLQSIGSKSAAPALSRLLKNGDAEVRTAAACALTTSGDRSSVPALVGALGDEYEPARSCAARALGEIGGTAAAAALARVLEDGNSTMGDDAADGLIKIGDRSVVPGLIALLESEDYSQSWTRIYVVRVLGELGGRPAVRVLIAALKDDELSDAATEALGKLGYGAAAPALKAADRRRHRSNDCPYCKALQRLGAR